MSTPLDIIYNTTLLCPWDCEICCVDAIHVKKTNGKIISRSEGLNNVMIHDDSQIRNANPIEKVYEERKKLGKELSLQQKLIVLDHLNGFDVKLDISGGDPLMIKENYEFLQIASKKLGKENITLTATGLGLGQYKPNQIFSYINEFNFTFDANSISDVVGRPKGYANSNLAFATKMALLGCKTRAEFPMNRNSLSIVHITKLYKTLHDAGIDNLLIMRLFPVGRGSLHSADIPTKNEYVNAIKIFYELEKSFQNPKVKLQCALRHIDAEKKQYSNYENPCDLIRESFGLMADGSLLASPWAINSIGKPLHESWVLGNLYQTPLKEILNSNKTSVYRKRLNENFGHCKIFSYLNSSKKNVIDRIFDKTDPLYKE